MKIQILLLLALLSTVITVQAQITVPEKGSEWVYSYENISACGALVAIYKSDTTLAGKSAMVLKETLYNACTFPEKPYADTLTFGQNIIAI
jgi:hypothetical protein